jgi:tetratricopeptide (TPR) repeat protein
VNRTDERDAQQTPAGREGEAAAEDLTVAGQPAAEPDAEQPRTAVPVARVTAATPVVVGDIPAQRSGFQPRPVLLAELNRESRGEPAVLVLTGMPGAGKTQLAAAYARARAAARWRLVAWVSAENTGNLLAGLAAVADGLGLSDGGSGRGATDPGPLVRRWLEADGERCLLVFDAAGDLEMLRPFVPVAGAARVLITGPRDPAPGLGVHVPVGVFTAEEALALLDGRTGLADEAGAVAVAAELGHLPLALDQVAAVMAGQYMGYGAFLRRLRAGQAEENRAEGQEQSYPPGVAEAVRLSVEAIRAADPAGVGTGVLEAVAVLSAAGVRRELLHAAGQAGALGAGGHRVAAEVVDQALAQLAEQALLTLSIDGRAVIMHPLVARVVRAGLARTERLITVCRAVASVLHARADAMAGSPDRAAVRDIPRQVTALLASAGPAALADERLASVMLRLRFWALYHLIELGDSTPQAIEVGEPLTADLELALGPDHPDTLNARNSLAAAYQAAGRPAEAIPLFEQTLVSLERLLGPDDPDTLTAQNNLAATYQDVGRLAEAILLFRLTLAARERLDGPDHPSTLNSRGNLAAAYRAAGQINEAVPLLEQTLAARERVLGGHHFDTTTSRNNLASAYREAGRSAEAIPLVHQILAIRERQLGPDHSSTLAARNNLAAAYRAAGRPAEAIPLFEQNLAACERLLGVGHPRTVASRHNLAHAQEEAGQTSPQLVVDGDGDGDADVETDGDGEGDLDGLGDGEDDVEGLGDRDGDGFTDREDDGSTDVGNDWTGGARVRD